MLTYKKFVEEKENVNTITNNIYDILALKD